MVALHNRKLTACDIWPSNVWTEKDRLRVRTQIDAEMKADGVSEKFWQFERSRRYGLYLDQFGPGGMRHQQEVMRGIYPPDPPLNGVDLTDEELEYLINRLQGANDEVGQGILAKLRAK